MPFFPSSSTSVDNLTIDTDASGAIQVKTSNITPTSGLNDITYSSNTTLAANVIANNVTINSGVTLTTNGYAIICNGTFTNNGTVTSGSNSAGGAGSPYGGSAAAGTSYTSSYGGSGGGGGGQSSYNNGASGGATLASPGAGGSGGAGGPGATSTAPSVTNSLINTWYTNGFTTYFQGAGGGGGGAGGNTSYPGGAGGGGSLGVFIQAYGINAGTINASGTVGANAPNNGGGSGGGGGGGCILLAYGAGGYTSGSYNYSGGAGGTTPGSINSDGGTGGNGILLTFNYSTQPIPTPEFTFSNSNTTISAFSNFYNYFVSSTTSTTPVSIDAQTYTPSKSGVIKITVVARSNNSTIGDGLIVSLYQGSALLDQEGYTQEGLAGNPHTFVLTNMFSGSVGTPYTFSVQHQAVTGGTVSTKLQAFYIEEVY